MNKGKKLELLDPAAITAFVAAFMGDCVFVFLILGVLIPVVGLVILAVILAAHYLLGLVAGALVIPKLSGGIPKLVCFLVMLLPLPTLIISLLAGILLQNKFLQTAALVAVGAVTGGTGAVTLRGAAMAEEVAEGGVAAEEIGAAKAGTSAGRSVAAAEETGEGELAQEPGTAGAEAKEGVSPEALGEEPEPMEKLRQRLLEETPSGQDEEQNGDEEETAVEDKNNVIDLSEERERRMRVDTDREAANDPDFKRKAA